MTSFVRYLSSPSTKLKCVTKRCILFTIHTGIPMFSETQSTAQLESFSGVNFRGRVGQQLSFSGINFPKWRKFWACFLIFVPCFAVFWLILRDWNRKYDFAGINFHYRRKSRNFLLANKVTWNGYGGKVSNSSHIELILENYMDF